MRCIKVLEVGSRISQRPATTQRKTSTTNVFGRKRPTERSDSERWCRTPERDSRTPLRAAPDVEI